MLKIAGLATRIDDPTPDIAQLAKGLGVEAIGPVETRDDLVAAMQQAVAAVRAGKTVSRRCCDRVKHWS